MTNAKEYQNNKVILYVIIAGILLAGIVGLTLYFQPKIQNSQPNLKTVKIGIVSDFSGNAANLGKATELGFQMAKNDLVKENINLDIKTEDYKSQVPEALKAVQKLESVEKVDGYYIDFNAGILSSQNYLKDLQKPVIFNAAAVSPLSTSPNFFKSFIDFKDTCKQIAQKFKDRGVTKLAQLKHNIEFGELCNQGIKEVFSDNLVTLGFNMGENDFKPYILKAKTEQVQAVMIISSFESDLVSTLKSMIDLDFKVPIGGSDSAYTQKIKDSFVPQMENSIRYDIEVNPYFISKIKNADSRADASTYYQTATAYLHAMQLGQSISKCDGEIECIDSELNNAKKDSTSVIFEGFENRIAKLKLKFN